MRDLIVVAGRPKAAAISGKLKPSSKREQGPLVRPEPGKRGGEPGGLVGDGQ
jgi:hypothetical protein